MSSGQHNDLLLTRREQVVTASDLTLTRNLTDCHTPTSYATVGAHFSTPSGSYKAKIRGAGRVPRSND